MKRGSVDWLGFTPLTTDEQRILTCGNENNSSESPIVPCRDFPFFRFSVYASHACTLYVYGSLYFNFASPYELFHHDIPATTHQDAYNLTGVWANNNGWVTLCSPFVRLRLDDTVSTNHTALQFYAQAWG